VSASKADPFNAARIKAMEAYHLLASVKSRVEQLSDDDANELSYAIDGVRALLEEADDLYGKCEAKHIKVCREFDAIDRAAGDMFERLQRAKPAVTQ
jgi:hypothetical protein